MAETTHGVKTFLLVMIFALFCIIAFGLIWFFFFGPSSPVGFGWYIFSFAAGLSMIVLPCTLPLAFVIVPLSMGKGALKGFLVALAFGIGVALTLSLYGVFAALLGKVAIGSLGAPLESVKNWLYFIAGSFAYIFALGELGLINFRMPTYTGAFPGWIQKQQDILKALLLGLFLGNIGIGCPHPATPVILTRIAVSGDVFYGWLLFFTHAIGRIIPLIFLAILGIFGVNALSGLVKYKDKIERATGWGMVFVAGFILVLGFFSHDWWVQSGQHTYLEGLTQEEFFLNAIASHFGVANVHHHGMPAPDKTGLLGFPLAWGTDVLLFLWILPLFWDYKKKKKAMMASSSNSPPDDSEQSKKRIISSLFWNRMLVAVFLIAVFGYTLPNLFLDQTIIMNLSAVSTSTASGGSAPPISMGMPGMNMSMPGMNMANPSRDDLIAMSLMMHGPTRYQDESETKSGPSVQLTVTPKQPKVGETVRLDFFSRVMPEGAGIPESELEVQHTKKMHVIGVRSDLKEFFHIHPVTVADRPASVLTITRVFSKPGEYKIWPEIKYKGVNYIFSEPPIRVSGPGPTASEPEKDLTLTKVVGDATTGSYQVRISYGQLGLGYNHVDFFVKNPDGSFTPLENYLDAQMHLTLVSEDLGTFIHTHPSMLNSKNNIASAKLEPSELFIKKALAHGGSTMQGNGAQSDHVSFEVPFVHKGFYKLFAQFRPAGVNLPPDTALTAEFWVEVTDAAPTLPQSPPGPFEKLRIAIVSVILMAALSFWVKRYITPREDKTI